ncbi:MAG: long-chain fatty acid--CoA ligase [Rhodocyclaceae bacterium]|nr:long-chain fatty acid--CoA ligase [Rhodocyclaceae bacterium]
MQIIRHWLSRADPAQPALVLPDGRALCFGDLITRRGRSGLQVLEGDAQTLALGLIDCALGGGTALLLPPGLTPETREALVAQARRAASPQLALIVTTSGSTGAPKGVRLTWRAVAAAARIGARGLDLRPGDAWLACLPLHFVGGATNLFRTLRAGATAVVHDGFDVETVARTLVDRRITHISLVPAMLAKLLEGAVSPAPSFGPPTPSPALADGETACALRANPPAALRCALVGGAALAPALEEKARAAGWPIRLSYGMTETCATLLVDGRPLPGVKVRLADDGTLEVSSPARMDGYLGEAEAGEWLATRDLAMITADGRVSIHGRADEMLISGGVNVHPLEVEARLAACPGVHQAGVTGLPDPVWGDLIACAYEGEADEAAVEAWCRATLPSPRRPRRLLRVSRLPRLASGKLDRRALRSLWP